MKKLPTTSGLQMFVAAARSESFVRAAETLGVTQAAISKQIQQLELLLGHQLFDRGHKSVRLTNAGHQYVPIAEQAVALLSDKDAGLDAPQPVEELVIEIDPEILHFWLLPRIALLRERFPWIHLRFVPALHKSRRIGPDVDCGIVFGRPPDPGLHVETFLDFDVFPVCSPGYAEAGEIARRHFGELELLHDFDTSWWDELLSVAGVAREDNKREIVFGQPIHALEAAQAGLGLAVGDDVTCRAALEAGSLIRPVPLSLPGRESYYLVTHRNRNGSQTLQKFLSWLNEQAAEQRDWAKRDV